MGTFNVDPATATREDLTMLLAYALEQLGGSLTILPQELYALQQDRVEVRSTLLVDPAMMILEAVRHPHPETAPQGPPPVRTDPAPLSTQGKPDQPLRPGETPITIVFPDSSRLDAVETVDGQIMDFKRVRITYWERLVEDIEKGKLPDHKIIRGIPTPYPTTFIPPNSAPLSQTERMALDNMSPTAKALFLAHRANGSYFNARPSTPDPTEPESNHPL